MNSSYLKRVVALVFSAIIALIGFVFLQNAANWGIESINNYVRTKMGGSYDTTQYNIQLEQYISSYKWIGAILLVTGLVFLFRSIEKILINKNNQTP